MTSPEQAPSLEDAVSGALHDHIADTGGLITSYYMVATFIDADGEQRWIDVTPPEQTQSTTMGLIEWSRGVARHKQQRYLDRLDG